MGVAFLLIEAATSSWRIMGVVSLKELQEGRGGKVAARSNVFFRIKCIELAVFVLDHYCLLQPNLSVKKPPNLERRL